jgi:hypothetical protein
LVHLIDSDGYDFVMPAQAGIQGDSALADSDAAWIPAFAGMTPFSPSLKFIEIKY